MRLRSWLAGAVVVGFLSAGVPALVHAQAHPGRGDYDDHHTWRDAGWWQERHPDWAQAHHPDWAKNGDWDDHHRHWHDRDWWRDHHPNWAHKHHPDWF
jgi:hypothetical protein